MYTRLAQELTVRKHPACDFVVGDEAQDVSVSQLRFLAALGANRPNGLFFAGDLGQRIFQVPFSWSSQGVDVRGRARTLHVNYRTSHQIRMQADRLLAPEVADVDGNTEDRRGTVSVFNGPEPFVQTFDAPDVEIEAVAAWLANIRNYFPDFISLHSDGSRWIIETKGREDIEVKLKDNAAINWCRTATDLTGEKWNYIKVLQKDFESMHVDNFEELLAGINPPKLFE